ncbi:MAG TPA: outer membrane beta-barrel protein, partial [Puia sp.]
MTKIISFSFITILICSSTLAQTTASDTAKAAAPAPALSITGSADFYYRYNFNKQVNDYTSFTASHNNFKLGMASVKLEHKTAKMDMVADLGFGPRAQEFAYNDNGIVQAIKQLYISYSPTAWVKFTGGTWATHIGYEVLDAYANRNYSMSYMFTNGPFSHTGIKADLTFGKSGFMIGVSNPTDWRSVPEAYVNKKNLIAQYSYAPNDNIKLYLNYVGGRDTG